MTEKTNHLSNLQVSQLNKFRLLAFIEGVSFLIILFVTMPLKYMFAMPMPNKIFGMLHGVLFILYVLAVIFLKISQKWNFKKTFLALLASIIPFGTFWADTKLFKITTVLVLMMFAACTPQERKSREFIAEGMKDRKIKRVTDVQLLTAATDIGKQSVVKLNEMLLPKIDISKSFDCSLASYFQKDSIKFMYVKEFRLVCQASQTKYDKEKQVFEAYSYNSANDKEFTDNIQKIDGEAIIYTSAFTMNGKFIGMWTIVLDKKELVKNI
jgi:integral membrane protein